HLRRGTTRRKRSSKRARQEALGAAGERKGGRAARLKFSRISQKGTGPCRLRVAAANTEHRTLNIDLRIRPSELDACSRTLSELDVGCSSFAFATARQASACHAEAFGVGGLGVFPHKYRTELQS